MVAILRDTKPRTKRPTPNSRLCPGCRVLIASGRFKGHRGKAMLLVSSMWLVRIDGVGQAVSLHRSCLKRIPEEGSVAAA